jgi:hypothetical protein
VSAPQSALVVHDGTQMPPVAEQELLSATLSRHVAGHPSDAHSAAPAHDSVQYPHLHSAPAGAQSDDAAHRSRKCDSLPL